MTLLDEIKARCSSALIASEDTHAMADAVSAGRTKIVSTMLGTGDVLAVLGAGGGPFLDALVSVGESDRNVYWAMELIRGARLDVGMAATRLQVTALAQANPSIADAAHALLALAERPDPISELQVRAAIRSEDGTWLGG